MAKFFPGDRVHVKTETGEGEGRVIGLDPESGTYRVEFDRLKAQGRKLDGTSGYVPPESLSRKRGK